MEEEGGITRAFLGVAAVSCISHYSVVPGGTRDPVSIESENRFSRTRIFRHKKCSSYRWLVLVWTHLCGLILGRMKRGQFGVRGEMKKN